MAHAQKPEFSLLAKRASPFKSAGASVQSTASSRGVHISGSNAGYTMFRSSVKSTGCPLHSPVSPPLPLPCATACHHISTGLYKCLFDTAAAVHAAAAVDQCSNWEGCGLMRGTTPESDRWSQKIQQDPPSVWQVSRPRSEPGISTI